MQLKQSSHDQFEITSNFYSIYLDRLRDLGKPPRSTFNITIETTNMFLQEDHEIVENFETGKTEIVGISEHNISSSNDLINLL